jgi:hypothetical protein
VIRAGRIWKQLSAIAGTYQIVTPLHFRIGRELYQEHLGHLLLKDCFPNQFCGISQFAGDTTHVPAPR